MLYVSYEEQRSFPEYVDFVMKDIIYKPCTSLEWAEGMEHLIRSWKDVYELILEGYGPMCSGEENPEWLVQEDYSSTRRVKQFCRDLFREYGELDKVDLLMDSRFKCKVKEWADKGEPLPSSVKCWEDYMHWLETYFGGE